jgi:predicted CXXCH cytochrome family protein
MPTPETVGGDFNGATFTHNGRTSRFTHSESGYFIETMDVSGAPKSFKVMGVVGIAPLQQYLVETEPGRLQSFDVVWDQEKHAWYHLYPDQTLHPDDGYHWSGPYKNWNARCAECHATEFEKNYSPRTKRYQSTQAEIGVGCEACHGPGEAHVAWARNPDGYSESPFPDMGETGFLVEYSKGLPETEIQQCAGCHSRREPYQDGNPLPGTPFHDSYRLALLRDSLYHPDGQILDEVYVYGSFLQSEMYEKGVRCSNCHEPHSATLKAEGNALCTQCHSPAGASDFPSLTAKLYDDPSHHFHDTGTAGANCTSCHMIERNYMGIDGRRDHSFRVPRPDLSARIATPNACTDCHADRPASWAALELEQRFPKSLHRGPHFAEIFSAARSDTGEFGDELLAIALDPALPGIVRATALELLNMRASQEQAGKAEPLLEDDDPLIRAAAVALQMRAPSNERTQRIVAALDDPVKSVRITAARKLLGLPIAHLPKKMALSAQRASGEWQAALGARADFPETHMVIGGSALILRNPRAAMAAFQEVTRMDPQLVEAWGLIVRLHAANGDWGAARSAVQRAQTVNPNNPYIDDLIRWLQQQSPSD